MVVRTLTDQEEPVTYREYRGQEVREIGKIIQHCAIVCNWKNAKKWETTKVEQKLG